MERGGNAVVPLNANYSRRTLKVDPTGDRVRDREPTPSKRLIDAQHEGEKSWGRKMIEGGGKQNRGELT